MKTKQRPVIFGEVLFDVFPDGSRLPGGAPFNVAWHLCRLGLSPLLASRIGNDEPGRQLQSHLNQCGIETSAIQMDPVRPTPRIEVVFKAGEPSFIVPPDQAYDYIEADPLLNRLGGDAWALLYSGTSALRRPGSRATFVRCLEEANLPLFLDLNLRPPWWDRESIGSLLATARWVKLNHEELAELSEIPMQSGCSVESVARRWFDQYNWELLAVTLGKDGALFVSTEGTISQPVAHPIQVCDTVGAGDAFSAVLISGLIQGWSPPRILKEAVAYATGVCTFKGATGAQVSESSQSS